MSGTDLEVQIEKRKQKARDRGIFDKAFLVVRYLGGWNSLDDGKGTEGKEYSFRNDDFAIISKTGSYTGSDGGVGIFSLIVSYKGKMVYDGFVEAKSYIPGKWETALDKLWEEAKEAKIRSDEKEKNEKEKITDEKEANERKKWDL